jgi:hypothetical protein
MPGGIWYKWTMLPIAIISPDSRTAAESLMVVALLACSSSSSCGSAAVPVVLVASCAQVTALSHSQ